MNKRNKLSLIGCFIFPFITSCSTNMNQTTCQTNLTLVVEKEDNRNRLSVGETNQITAHVYGGSKDEVIYQSLTSEILNVSDTGLVTALKKGTGRIQVSVKGSEQIKKIVSYEVSEKFSQTYPMIQETCDKFLSYDYEKGVLFPLDLSLDIGTVSGNVLSTIDVELFDTNNTSKYGNLKLPINLYMLKENDEDMAYISLETKTFLNDIFSRNILLSSADKLSNIKGNIYKMIFSYIDSPYDDYLDEVDYKDITSLDYIYFSDQTLYSALERNFETTQSKQEHVFGFSQVDVISLFSPLIQKYISNKNDEEENETEIDFSSLLSKDGLVQLSSLLSSYIDESINENTYIYSLNETAIKFINIFYQEYVTSPIVNIESDDFKLSFSLPSSIESIYFEIKNNSSNHSFEKLNFKIIGKRYDTDENFDFLTLSLNGISQDDGTIKEKKKEFKNDIKALESVSIGQDKIEIPTLIKESEILYQAEKNYGGQNNQNMKDKKDELLSYYYSSFISSEMKNLLYPLYRRLVSLDLSYQDSYVVRANKVKLTDDENAQIEVFHLSSGEKKNDFTYTLKSLDEEMFSISEDNKVVPLTSFYNGKVNDNNIKEVDDQASVQVVISKEDGETTSNTQTKTISFKYVGSKATFRKTMTTFIENDNFDTSTREYKVKVGDTFNPSTLLSLPSNAIATYSSLDESLAKKTSLLSSNFTIFSPNTKKNLVGIKANVIYQDDTLKNETVIFYLRIE